MTDFTRFQNPESITVSAKEDTSALDASIGEEHLKELEVTVERLKVLNNGREEPFDDDVIEVPRFCRCLENIFHYQQKEKLTFWSERKDYYHYLTEGTSGLKSLDILIKNIQSMTELVTVQGKGRALIRFCLAQQLLADCVQSAIANTKKTKDWYNPSAVVLNSTLSGRLVSSLYDLSTMKFKLPVVGITLDESWPSFVQKSFSFKGVADSASPRNKSGRGSTNQTNRDPAYNLETAIEESPSDIFVKREIPFDFEVVSRLFSDIRSVLTEEFEGYTQESVLPEINVAKLDDVSSALSLLKDYVTTMSEDVTGNSHRNHEVIKELRYQSTEGKRQLKDSEEKVITCQMQIKSLHKMVDTVKEDNAVLKEENVALQDQIVNQEQEIDTLKGHNQHFEECTKNNELLKNECAEAEQKVNSRTQKLEEENEALQKICKEKEEEFSALNETLVALRSEIKVLKEEHTLDQDRYIVEMEKVVSENEKASCEATLQLSTAEESHQKEKTQLREQMSTLSRKYESCNEEKESVKQELRTVQGLVEQETVSLRFHLSTNEMQLQQSNKDVADKEKVILSLKQKLKEHKDELVTRSDQEAKMEELKLQLSISETTCKTLQDDLKSTNSQLTENTFHCDVLREESLKMQRHLDDQKDRTVTDFQKLSHQVSVLTEENEHLRKALQKLLQQKVNLWQHADELEQDQVSKGIWIDSGLVTNCMECSITFGIFTRKHHCRSCGKVFCTQCCADKVQLPSNRDKVRVCKACFDHITSLRTPLASELVNTLEKEETQLSNSTVSDEPINVFPGGVSLSDSNILHLSHMNDSDESLLQHVKDLITTTPRNSSKRVSLDNSTDYSVDPLRSPVTTQSYSVPNSDNGSNDPDDEFCVIDLKSGGNLVTSDYFENGSSLDVHTLRSKLATIESSNNGSPNISFNHENGNAPIHDCLQEIDDLEVVGGGMHQVFVEVDTPRTKISWQFSSQPRGIAMGLNYNENKKEDVIPILPEKRVMSHKTLLVGEYVAQKAGIYTLVFNNSHSKYSGRLLSYKVWKNCPQ